MYTERLMDHYRNPRNKGHFEAPDLAAEEYNALCGDRVTIELRIQQDQIVDARFEGRGCALCLAAASILTEVIKGSTLEEVKALGEEEFLAELDSTPRPSRLRCALLPLVALRRAAFAGDGCSPGDA